MNAMEKSHDIFATKAALRRAFKHALLHTVVFSKELRWMVQTKIITLKTQLHAVNAR